MPFVKRSDLNRPLTSGEVDNNFTLAETLFYAGQAAGKVFENTTDGLAGTTDGQFFTVPDGAGGFSVYRNDAGVETLIGSAGGPTGMDSPMTAAGDLITGGTSGTPSRLGIGADDQVLTVVGGVPAWLNPSPTPNMGGAALENYTDKTTDINVTAGTTTIDFAVITGRAVRLMMGVNTTLAFANVPTSGVTALTLICIQDSTGGRTLTFPTGTKYAGGTAPVLSTAAGAEDWLEVVFHPAMTGARVFAAGKGMA